MDFATALENFRTVSEEIIRAHFDRNGFTFAVPGVEIGTGGRKYIKVWRTETRDGQTVRNSIHAFVEVATGNIFMPASYKAPAKHERGNIYDDGGRASMNPHGHVVYMR
jgi:hypothetical protein